MKNRMGTFYTNGRVANHIDRKKSAEIPKMLVDTGAEFTWINSDTLKSIGVKREKKDYTFVMANGNQITRAVGYAILRVGDAGLVQIASLISVKPTARATRAVPQTRSRAIALAAACRCGLC